ncbi:hypothetical protein [Streptomyces sp. GC420]|uniref:hypothetical protein n=1 Tax=Streptomyces sp. GC420 TaxID=2697568 RepID=UPI001414F9A1|nr:hypothetical protein [Streptomyces sp. GC420]
MPKRIPYAAAAGLAALALFLTGCGDSDGDQPDATATTATAPATETTGSPTAATSEPQERTSPPGEEESAGPVRKYPGAEVTTETTGFTMLRTDDSVSEVGDFYIGVLEDEGWDIRSKYEGETSVHLLATRGDKGVTIQVSPTGSDTLISIAHYSV